MFLIAGLGNPGAEHARQRHNVGFMAADVLADTYGISGWKKQFRAEVASGHIDGEKVLLLKPQTYMNLSGEAAGEAARFYKIPPERIVALYDELDLPVGRLRIKQNGGHGGHNGIRSLDAHLGKNYWRVRIGIDHPGHKDRVTPHVLGNFKPEEEETIGHLLQELADTFPLIIKGDTERCMTDIARRMQTE